MSGPDKTDASEPEKLADEKYPARSPSIPSSDDDAYYATKDKALVRKLDRKILPPLTLLYLLSFLDRSNGLIARQTWSTPKVC